MTDITQPHDRLFKVLLSTPETAGALLKEYLPPEVARRLAPEPPQLVEGSFVEENLRPYYSDRLFETRTMSGKPVCFYILIEHKSFEDDRVGWQIFRGISAFFEQKIREDEKWRQLPAVLALLVYNGAHPWRSRNEFLALVDADEVLHPWLLNFRFPVVDLGPIPDGKLARNAQLRAGLMALKYGTRDPESQMAALDQIVSALFEAPELLLPILLYLLTTFHHLNEEQVRQVVHRVKPEEEYNMMSQFAQEIISRAKPEWERIFRQEGFQEGEQKGEQKGEKKGEAKILTRLLQRRFGAVPDWVSDKIAEAEPSSLEEWSLRFVDAKSLDDIFSDKV
ncbi:MAG: Rpn family recombination-promoting nuclease/putative transposase [Magnetococcales bacterium]|nr:Rpn family recombination-promoting nuclease/putative transposase [Magnetococcales bacterium]